MIREQVDNAYPVVNTGSRTDYVKSGTLYTGSPMSLVMVESQSQLSTLEGYGPGTIAYTAGFGSMWQMDADGTWTEVAR